ncbi:MULTISPECIES: hypothetical protein [Brevibacterium]|uniref:Uncharacterized protein n=1 Tax=Brevibacterium antiquum CNRZ 918 TaxID=1255637 RepID=A0A2H1K233_9MICO|nr:MULTISPECIES: hypothetical protein [Brevibacterium]SMX93790.1 hypothetical protein BANT918_02070 [Brevibacterium antiquum CNRZ 918]
MVAEDGDKCGLLNAVVDDSAVEDRTLECVHAENKACPPRLLWGEMGRWNFWGWSSSVLWSG